MSQVSKPQPTQWLRAASGVAAIALAAQTIWLTTTMWTSDGGAAVAKNQPLTPAYDVQAWRRIPVQAGRAEPFQTASADFVREITGRGWFLGQDPMAITLAWMLTDGGGAPGHVDWEQFPCILCEYTELRSVIYAHRHDGAPKGRHVAPAILRESPGFDQLLETVARMRAEHQEKAHLYLNQTELKAEEVGRRLVRYDTLCGRPVTRLHFNALAGEQYLNLRERAIGGDATIALNLLMTTRMRDPSPLRLVPIDRASQSAWFSLVQLRLVREDGRRWDAVMQERFLESPHRYLAESDRELLRRFQEAIAAGSADAIVADLAQFQEKQRVERLNQFVAAERTGTPAEVERLLNAIVRTEADRERVQKAGERARLQRLDAPAARQAIQAELGSILKDQDEQVLHRLRQGLEHARPGVYRSDDSAFRPLHLDYLEARLPDLYRRTAATRQFPHESADAVLNAHDRLRIAYRSGNSAQFDAASQEFFSALQKAAATANQPYPGVDTIELELAFNRLQPFRWAWVAMLFAAACFAIRLGLADKALRRGPRIATGFAYSFGFVSLALQLFGFYARVRISGWAPVSNMYETIIFAALMSFVFSLVLEAIYRRTVFALTGSIVSMLGLILADNLPLDSSMGGLVPVLRTNFWLTVHVVTIICGYAAGALAWGVGNLTLALLAFGRGDRDTLKLLSQFTYRAVQLTVVLLATGTFLGGWWASQAWGRFWGWDPKEVGALVALVCYVVPLHARYVGWVREFGLAVCAVLCFGSILISWYVINFVLAAGLHSYGFGGGGGAWVAWGVLVNVFWLCTAAWLYQRKQTLQQPAA